MLKIRAITSKRTFKSAMFSSSFSATWRNHNRRGFCDRTKSADHRNWIFASSHPTPDQERFKVLSYNILADYLALDHQSILYTHIPNHILAWEWRKRRLFIEFGLWSPDIMCLQEVDQFCELEGELAIRGYAGVWKMRTGNAVDGCAIFWRTNRFQLRHEENIEFSKLGLRDNVAQICVLESKMRFPENAAFPSSYNLSRGANQVVVCNTHVLYNPKRGEIKLGQVRILLDRAFAISRDWNDAPVIVCGDFNSIPMSPLYKFIATRKLDFSGLARDQISGQYSATLHSRANSRYSSYRPQTFSPCASESRFGSQEGYCRTRSDNQHNMGNSSPTEKSTVALYQDVEQKAHGLMSSGASIIKSGKAEIFSQPGGEVSSTYSELANMPSRTSEHCSEQMIIHADIDTDKNREVAHENIWNEPYSEGHKVSSGSGDLAGEIKLASTSCMNNSTASPLHNTVNIHSFQKESSIVGNVPFFHSNKDDFSTMDKEDDFLSEEKPCTSCASLEVQMVENTENSSTGSAVTKKAGFLITCHNSGKDNGLNPYSFDGSHVSDRIGVISCVEDEKIMDYVNYVGDSRKAASNKILEETPALCGNLSRDVGSTDKSQFSELSGLDEHEDSQSSEVLEVEEIPALCGNLSRDVDSTENSQLSELSGVDEYEDRQSSEVFGLEENADPNFFKELLGMEDGNQSMKDINSPNLELQENSSFHISSAAFNVERHFYNPYCWSPMEMEIASGNAKCTVVEHPLKLRSVYTDVEDYTGTKDSCREPQVTSYNQRFMGTVDYIWCSEDLQTVKVLDTIPKHVLQRTHGFPTHKWGSDHIALACELAFYRGSQSKKIG